jgi:hypothetical protein
MRDVGIAVTYLILRSGPKDRVSKDAQQIAISDQA